MDNGNFFDKLVSVFTSVFANIETEMFKYFSKIFLGDIISGFLTLVIVFYFTRKIKEGQFEIPKDIYDIIAFLLMVIFVNYCLNNQSFMTKIVNYLQMPANILSDFVKNSRALNLSGNTIGQILNDMVIGIADRAYIFTGSDGISLFKLSIKSVVGFLLWLVYAWFGVILIASITMTFILTLMQIQFWKCFAVIMIPLIYFKATRGMTIFWLKTIIALSLISSFMIIIGHLSSSVEDSLIPVISNEEYSYGLLIAFIIAKIITITFLKEIPAMINGMLGTHASGSTGAFANSVAMGSIGAAGAGAGFAAFKGAMRGGKVASGGAKTAGNWFKNQGGAANQLNKDVGGGSAGGSGSATSGGSNIGGNISKKTANISTGNSNSSIDSNNWKQGLSNIWNGKAYQHKEPPK